MAVANVVAFGTFGMLAYPYLAHHLLAPESAQVGLFLGTAVHDTSQVLGSAMTYKEVYGDEAALQCAAVTKLTRNLFLAGVIPGLAWASAREQARLAEAGSRRLPTKNQSRETHQPGSPGFPHASCAVAATARATAAVRTAEAPQCSETSLNLRKFND